MKFILKINNANIDPRDRSPIFLGQEFTTSELSSCHFQGNDTVQGSQLMTIQLIYVTRRVYSAKDD